MVTPRVVDLGQGRQLLDLDFRDTEGLIAAYLLPGPDGWSLVETGPTTCHAALLEAIGRAGVDRDEVRRVLVTHIHLDHAGGLGALAASLPSAQLYAHEAGVPHLVEPSRLAASARRAWGPAADSLWGPIVPVPPDRLHALRGGETFPLQGGTLEVLATPGHARHHLAFFDSAIRGLFTGDAAGVRLERAAHARPAVPPPDLDLEALFDSVARMRATDPRLVLYSHFGPSPDGVLDLDRYPALVEAWRAVALEAARESADVAHVAAALRRYDASGGGRAEGERAAWVSDYSLAAAGLVRYFTTHGLLERASA